MVRVVRRSLLDEVAERLPVSTTALVAIVVGAVTFYIFCRRKGIASRPSTTLRRPLNASKAEGGSSDLMTRIKQGSFMGKKVCIAWEVLHDGKAWKADGKALSVLQFYAFSSELYLMCHIEKAEDKKRILDLVKDIDGIERHRVLFCTTHKGYEAFTRQIDPSLLITHDAAQVSFLKRVIHSLVLVEGVSAVGGNVLCVPSVAALEVDAE
ncbi:hypothetical protein ABL78_2369 [Leptomonas seymouri]|uniref:Uncharacterized protein n=1 Tax=Leptomonas seymouri TaxID=5684 RepID=A0A0N0P7N3_LEPSE|nr:hypothetical protein ABL78_2369 [Leptomonas seymouri]|eukprot:KPI88557.1 hypothetical protein ABL78_2369 [Leptomonas seymouri]